MCFRLPSVPKQPILKTCIGPSEIYSCSFLCFQNFTMKQNCLHLVCYAAVFLVYSSYGYYSVCDFVFISCCVCYTKCHKIEI